MKKTGFAVILFTIIFFIIPSSGKDNKDDWLLDDDSDGIKIYTKDLKGNELRGFKGIGSVDSRLEVIAEVLLDIPGYTEWMAFSKVSKIVKYISETSFIVYSLYDLPWPVSDRDSVTKVSLNIDNKTGKCIVTLKPAGDKYVPKKEGKIRLETFRGKIWLEYVNRETTRGGVEIVMDPGGYIPISITNFINSQIPKRALTGLKEKSKEKKYIELGKKSKYKKMIENSIEQGFLRK